MTDNCFVSKNPKHGKIIAAILATFIFAAAYGVSAGVKIIPPDNGIYHGAFPGFGGTEDIVTEQRINNFESLAGKQIAWAYFSHNWYNGLAFPVNAVNVIRDHGILPVIRLMPWHGEEFVAEEVFSLDAIISGAFDRELNLWADAAIEFASPLMVDFGVEVNGDWFPWNGTWNGRDEVDGYGDPSEFDGPERFRDAYRHIHDVFESRGADNITYLFHVNFESCPDEDWNAMAQYYPGDDYIDWIGISLYGAMAPDDELRDFAALMDTAYPEAAAVSPSKPIALIEFGVAELPGSNNKALWIENALALLAAQKYPRVKGVGYWNEKWKNENNDWCDLTINSSPEALAAYRAGIANPVFLTKTISCDCAADGVTLFMPSREYTSGEPCFCQAIVCNTEQSTLEHYPLFVILDVFGEFFFGPGFTQQPDNYSREFPAFRSGPTAVEVVPLFNWPGLQEPADGITFYGALTTPDMTSIFGEIGAFSFGWTN